MSNSRRGNGEGSVRKRPDGTWEARLRLDDGRRKSFYGKTRAEASRKLAACIRDQERGVLALGNERQSVARYLASWLLTTRATVEPSTYESYEAHVRRHLVPAFGRLPLIELTPQHVQHLMASMLAAGLAPNTVRNVRSTLRRALNEAMALGIVARNVATLTRKPKAARGEMRVYDEVQVRMLLAEAAATTRHEALITMAVTTGARLGELLALTWRNVNLERGYAQIQRNARRFTGRGIVMKDTKTSMSSRRKLELPAVTVDALRRHRTRLYAERLKVGPAYEDHHDLVFPTSHGTPLAASNFWREYRRIVARAGLPYIRPHDLRHTAATLALLQGVNPKKVQEMLGHASVAITLSLYSHVLPSMHRDAATAMDDLFGANGGGNGGKEHETS